MIDGLSPYPAYRDSGVPCLDWIPTAWESVPISRIGRLSKGNGRSKDDEVTSGIPCVRYGDLYTRHEFFIRSTKACVAPDRASAYTPIQYGDVLFAASGETIEDIGRSAVNLLDKPACCGGDILLLRPVIEVNPAFLGYAADALPSRHQKASMGRGFTVVHVYASELKRLMLALPPVREQAAIVRFLDHADRRIRRYIGAKQGLIKLLEEQNRAFVHRSVTQGINPSATLTPSGVEWLGNVPNHWEIRRNGQLFSQRNESGFDNLPILEVSLRTGVRVRDLEHGPRKQIMLDRSKYKRAMTGDIAYNTMRMWQGAVGVVSTLGLVSPAYVVARPRRDVDSRYYSDLFRTAAFKTEVDGYSRGIVKDRNRLYWEDFKQIHVPYPPPEEQARIAAAVEDQERLSSEFAKQLSSEIRLIGEYRTRLIADLVTGKLDVREAAANLPDEVDEPEAVDDELALAGDDDQSDDDDAAVPEVENE